MIRWMYAFLDRPRDSFGAAAEFWATVTGTRLSPLRGDHNEFATFVPPWGDAYLKLQAVGGAAAFAGGGGGHLDLVTDDVPELVERAVGLGCEILGSHADWFVMNSPGDQLFCITPYDPSHGETVRPSVVVSPDGVGSRLDQIAIDASPRAFAYEAEFWPALTGWPVRAGSRSEFAVVQQPDGLPIRLLIQRLDTPPGQDRPTSMHQDLACADVPAIRSWHERLGATYVADGPRWTVMRDPAGSVYCLTERSPETGQLA